MGSGGGVVGSDVCDRGCCNDGAGGGGIGVVVVVVVVIVG